MKINCDLINRIIIALIFISLFSMLFFPIDKIALIKYPIYFAIILAIIYLIVWKFKK